MIDNSDVFILGTLSLLRTKYNIKHGKSSKELFFFLEQEKFIPEMIFINNQLNHNRSLSGLDTVELLKDSYSEIPICIVTASEDLDLLRHCIEIGVNGFLLKNALKEDIIECIDSLISGNSYLCKSIPFEYLKNLLTKKIRRFDLLSPSEKKIFLLLSKGKTNKQISELLFISVHTVETHKYKVKTKLGIKTDIEILILGIKEKIPEILEHIGI